MAEFLKAKMTLELDDKKARAALKKTEKNFKKTIDRMKKFASKLADAFGSIFKKMLKAARNVALVLTGLFLLGIREAIKYETALVRMTKTLEATGGVVGLTTKELIANAAALQEMSTTSETAALAMQSLLLTFKNIRGEIFKRTTIAVLDMSEGMSSMTGQAQDLKSTVIQLGKALNDPILGITALSRVGIQFTDVQKDMIKNLVETNQLAKAQGVILTEIESQFGGAATKIDTTSKALLQLWNTFTDLLRAIGDPFLEPIKKVSKAMKEFFEETTEDIKVFTERITNALSFKLEAKGFGGALKDVALFFVDILKAGAIAFVDTLTTLLKPLFIKLGQLITESIAAAFPKLFRSKTKSELIAEFESLKDLRGRVRAGSLKTGKGRSEFQSTAGLSSRVTLNLIKNDQKALNFLIKKQGKLAEKIKQTRDETSKIIGPTRTLVDIYKDLNKSVQEAFGKRIDSGLESEIGKARRFVKNRQKAEAEARKAAGITKPESFESFFPIDIQNKFSNLSKKRLEEQVKTNQTLKDELQGVSDFQGKMIKQQIANLESLIKKEKEEKELAESRAIEKAQALKTIFTDLKDVAGEFLVTQELINIQAERFEEIGVSTKIIQRWKELQIEIAKVNRSGILSGLKSAIESVQSPMSNFFSTVIQGTESFKDAFKSMAMNIKQIFFDMISELIAKWVIFQTITRLAPNLAGAFGVSNPFGGQAAPVPALAGGGITQGVSIAGEAGPEAVVPLPDGRTIPVKMQGGGNNTTVNIINQTSQEVEATQGESFFDGEEWVVNVILNNINRGGAVRSTIKGIR